MIHLPETVLETTKPVAIAPISMDMAFALGPVIRAFVTILPHFAFVSSKHCHYVRNP